MGAKTNRRTPEEALRASVAGIGGLQEVGSQLKPESDPVLAGQWLAHCLTADKRDKLSLAQIVLIFHRAYLQGEHDGFQQFAALCGYEAKPVLPEELLAVALKRAQQAKADADETARNLQTLIENPKLLATLKAAHVNVGALGIGT